MKFEDLRLSEPLLAAVRAAGYRTPTPIQSNAIPVVLDGRDVLGCAQTGTGKTAAFALPVLQRLSDGTARVSGAGRQNHTPAGGRPAQRSVGRTGRRRPGTSPARVQAAEASGLIRALVLCPTRELALQIHDSFTTYGANTGIRAVAIFGGVNQNRQVQAVQAGADVVIATPGRLLDLMGQGLIHLGGVEILVLDEADRMLDMGFLPDIRRILTQVPRQRQSLLFSATMPAAIRSLANDILRDPVPIEVARVSSPATTVKHWVYHVEQTQKASLLVNLLARAAGDRALVFTRTKHGADRLTKHLVKAGVSAAAIHGNKSQNARTRALDAFRSARTPVLVATDVAARGLDVDDIAQVINYDLTSDPETYVHRIGRTGRAGASGTAVSFCTSQQRADLRAIEKLLQTSLEKVDVPVSCVAASRHRPAPTATNVGRTWDNDRSAKTFQGDANRRGSRRRGARSAGRRPRQAARV